MFMGYIDDATGNTRGRFYPYEGTFPAMDSFKWYIKKYGIPMSLHLDYIGIFILSICHITRYIIVILSEAKNLSFLSQIRFVRLMRLS